MLSYQQRRALELGLLAVTAGLGFFALYLVFLVVPNEEVMGPVQRVFYFHVGGAIATYAACAVILIGALAYLATRQERFDALQEAAAEVGLVFCATVMASGMIWGKAAWNTWFRWEPRLVSFLIMLLILLGLVLLRRFGDQARIGQHCAVLGILSAITVPLVVFSIALLPQFAQLHPQVIGNRGLREHSFVMAMIVSMVALILLQFQLIWLRYRVAVIERGLNES